MSYHYVIKADELTALNFLPANHVKPASAQWINRGTSRVLRKQSVDLLLRTLFADILSESVVKLHRSSGLQVAFQSEYEWRQFSKQFTAAKAAELETWSNRITMMFDQQSSAADTIAALVAAGVPKSAISMLWRAGQFMEPDGQWIEGHTVSAVAGATASGSIAGLALGVALIAVPGVGKVAAIGGLAATAAQAIPAIAGIFGATAATINKMLSDPDVDDVAIRQLASRQTASRVFVSLDLIEAAESFELARSIMRRNGGRLVTKSG